MDDLKTAPRIHRIPGEVFACLVDNEFRIVLTPGNAKAFHNVPADMVPFGSRLPNSPLWITWEQGGRGILSIETRRPDNQTLSALTE